MPRLTLLNFIEQAEKAPPPACIISGEETQLMEEARSAVCKHFSAENRRIIDLDKPLPEDEMAGTGKGLFGGGAELFQLFSTGKPSAAGLALVEALCQRVAAPDALMMVIGEWDYKYKKAAWFKKLSEHMPAVLCERLSAKDAKMWLRRWAAQAQLPLPDEALDFLGRQTEGNLFAAKQAIAKIALSAAGQPPDAQALRAALADGARYDVLDLSDAIYAGEPLRALTVLRQLRADRIPDTLIQWSVMNIINNITATQSGGRAPVWGWQAAALKRLAGKTSAAALARLTRQAAHADRAFKGVAGGEGADILCGIVMRLAAQQGGVKMNLPYTRL